MTDWVNLTQLLTFWFGTLALYARVRDLWGLAFSSHMYRDTNMYLARLLQIRRLFAHSATLSWSKGLGRDHLPRCSYDHPRTEFRPHQCT